MAYAAKMTLFCCSFR